MRMIVIRLCVSGTTDPGLNDLPGVVRLFKHESDRLDLQSCGGPVKSTGDKTRLDLVIGERFEERLKTRGPSAVIR